MSQHNNPNNPPGLRGWNNPGFGGPPQGGGFPGLGGGGNSFFGGAPGVPGAPASPSVQVIPPGQQAAAPTAAKGGLAGALSSLGDIKGIIDRMGGIDGLMANLGKVQKLMSTMQQMAPLIRLFMGKAKAAGSDLSDGVADRPRRRSGSRRRGGSRRRSGYSSSRRPTARKRR